MHFQPVEHMVDDAYIGRPQEGLQVDPLSTNDALDDVFGSGPSSPVAEEHHHETAASSAAHPSDIHRLQTEHTTAGYREGVTVSKESSLQAGFDEGFSLGASVGLKAGQLLGVLEGIAEAVRGREDTESVKAIELSRQAQEELSTASIFKADYWAEDSNWKYEVKPAEGADEVVFADVADAHPLIKKWAAVVEEQVALWKIDRAILDDEKGERLETVMDEPLISGAAPTAKKPLDW
ncbi:hypothetical protein NM208_g13331 [Fusarium decemcellulare]|uniref:Uncharacterized protein n=1 Tax=Fusarium decemcellulare TaxID=57161 RepID=A0ACC1RM61_9HYPO|nr:hypothetical protein NM208_g13331 [Fusarium decemcellulare]